MCVNDFRKEAFSMKHGNADIMDQIKAALICTLGLSAICWFLMPNPRLVWRLSNALSLGSMPGLALGCFRLARRWGMGDSFLFSTGKMRHVLKKDQLERKIQQGKADQQDLEEVDALERKTTYRDFHEYLQHKEEPKPAKALLLVNGAAMLCAMALTFL